MSADRGDPRADIAEPYYAKTLPVNLLSIISEAACISPALPTEGCVRRSQPTLQREYGSEAIFRDGLCVCSRHIRDRNTASRSGRDRDHVQPSAVPYDSAEPRR